MGQLWGWLLLIGSLMGFLAVMLSIVWHRIDKKMELLEPLPNETFDEADERWMNLCEWRNRVRVMGLVMLYGSLLVMCVGALGMGIDYVDREVASHGAK